MKKYLYVLFVGLLCCACEKISVDDLDGVAPTCKVKVDTRTIVELQYPVMLYAFDIATGELASTSVISDADNVSPLNLAAGSYQIVAAAGCADCDVQTTSLSGGITMPESGRLDVPLQMGSVFFTVEEDTHVNIEIGNKVAAVDLALADIPEETTAVNVSLSVLHSTLSFNGTLGGTTKTTLALTKEGDVWKAPRCYVLPTNGDCLTLSIELVSPSGTAVYGYTCPTPLLANTPYALNGSFQSGFEVNGVVTVAGWNEPQTINFEFGNDVVDDNNNTDETTDPSENTADVYTVTSIPEGCSFWNNHFVVTVFNDDGSSADLLLMSKEEWTDVTSASHETTPEMAQQLVEEYVEDGIDGWTIPTKDHVPVLVEMLGGYELDGINALLTENGLTTLSTGMVQGVTVRYLCEDATYSYTWDGGSVSPAGAKRTYHLRAVKLVHVEVAQ